MNNTSLPTRRSLLKTSLALGGAVAVASGEARAQDQKVPQEAVMYQPTPKDGQQCDACVNWVAPNGCKIVAGTISPKGYCVAFAPKEG